MDETVHGHRHRDAAGVVTGKSGSSRPRAISPFASSILTVTAGVGVAAYLCFQVFNYTTGWIHPDTLGFASGVATHNGLSPHLTDFRGVLADAEVGDRPRFLSTYLQTLDIKFRLFVLRALFPLPPGFSLSWIFSLLLAPLLLYHAVWNYTASRRAALDATLLYMVSMSSLSGILFRFMMGKPLTNFFVISVLWVCSLVHQASRQNRAIGRAGLLWDWRIALLFLYFTACLFLDETAFFAYLVLAVMLFAFLRDRVMSSAGAGRGRRLHLLNALIVAGPVLIFAVITFVIVPWISRLLGPLHLNGMDLPAFVPFNFLRYALTSELEPTPLASGFHLANFYHNFHTNFLANLMPAQMANPNDPAVEFKMAADGMGPVPAWVLEPLFVAFYLVFFGISARHLKGDQKAFARKAAICLVLFVLGQTILMVRHEQVANGYYYGALFGIFYAMLGGTVLAAGSGRLRVTSRLVLIMLLIIQTANFAAADRPIRALHTRWTADRYRKDYDYPTVTLALPTSRVNVWAIWHAWQSGHFADVRHWDRIPAQSLWLLREITLVRNWTGAREQSYWTEAHGLAEAVRAYHAAHGCYPSWTGAGMMPPGLAPYAKGPWPAGYHYLSLDRSMQGTGSRSTGYYVGVAALGLGLASEFRETVWVVHDAPAPIC